MSGNHYENRDAFEDYRNYQGASPFLRGYVGALLFGETLFLNDDGEQADPDEEDGRDIMILDAGFHWEDFDEDSRGRIVKDCAQFYEANKEDILAYGAEEAGSDYYFTRQGHGVGYWEEDHGTPEICKRLTEAAKTEGECYVDLNEGKLEYRS